MLNAFNTTLSTFLLNAREHGLVRLVHLTYANDSRPHPPGYQDRVPQKRENKKPLAITQFVEAQFSSDVNEDPVAAAFIQ